MRLGFGLEYNGDYYSDDTNLIKVPSYTVAHMVLTFEAMEGVRMQLNVNNLFNESYYRTVINSTQFIPAEGRNVQFTTSLSL
jgi:tonB-dependent siderophore receptor